MIKIGKTHYDFGRIHWVCKIRSKKIPRESLKLLFFDGEYLIATDTHRLHAATLRDDGWGFEKGKCYEVIKIDRSEIILSKASDELANKFPNVTNVIPKPGAHEKPIMLEGSELSRYTTIVRSMDEKTTLNFDFFRDAYEGSATFGGLNELFIWPGMQPILLRSERGEEDKAFTVIMPVLMKSY